MKQVLILGGGIAGLSVAWALEKRGASIHLVEKEERLGGKALDWACMATDEWQNCGACLSGEMVDQVEHLENALLAVAKKRNRFHLNHSASPPEYAADSSGWSLLKLPVASHGESSKCKELFFYCNSLANPAASRGECARYAFSTEVSLRRYLIFEKRKTGNK